LRKKQKTKKKTQPTKEQKVSKSKLRRFRSLANKLKDIKKRIKHEEDKVEELEKELQVLRKKHASLAKQRKLKGTIRWHKKRIERLKAQESKSKKTLRTLYFEIYKPAKKGQLTKHLKKRAEKYFMRKFLGL